MERLRDRVAIITGSTRGIGRAIAGRLAEEGAAVVVHGRAAAAADAVAADLHEHGHRTVACNGDVGDPLTHERCFAAALDAFGRVDILVNNAGTILVARLEDTGIDEWEALLSTNLTGVFLGCRTAARVLSQRGEGGRIINISSIGGRRTWPYFVPYGATKFAVIGLTQGLAAELGPRNITVNAVCPGNTGTDMWGDIDRSMQDRYGWEPG